MGVVYEALDRERNTRVALKTLRFVDPTALLRFKNEFRALQDLQHPNLVNLGELFEEDGQWFFTMELVEGVDLLTWVRSNIESELDNTAPTASLPMVDPAGMTGLQPATHTRRAATFDEQRLRSSIQQLARGLAALHHSGKVHRDIKPSNVLVTREGRVVLLDFGVVVDRSREGHLTDSGQVVGTAAYMAPEQGSSKTVGPEADWYSMGVVLYQALTGGLPFEGSSVEILLDKQRGEPGPPSAIAQGIPSDLDALCNALLRRDPRQRLSGSEVQRRLGGVEVTTVAPAPPTSQSFVGRDTELAALHQAFADARRGAAVTVCVRGESGVGKSALVREFSEQIERTHPGSVILAGRCNQRESVPYKALDQVIDALSRHLMRLPSAAALLPRMAPLLAQVFPVLWRVAAIAEAPRPQPEIRDPQELRRRAFGALRELFTRLCDRHPLVLIIDDLQWADADSLALLADVLRPPESPAMLLVATLRPVPETPELDAAAWIEGDLRVLSVGRLPPDQARALAALLLRRSSGAGAIDASAIAEEAEGHPLFIDELIRYVQTHGSHAGVHLDGALWARIDALEPPAQRFLEIVAAAGAPLAQSVVAQASALEPEEFARWAAVLRSANLVRATGSRGSDAVEPYHDRVRDAVLHHLDPETLRSHHQRIALALQASAQADPEALAIHWRGAGDRAKTVVFAAEAAARAAAAFAFGRAAGLYRMALESCDPNAAEAPQLRVKLGESLANAGRGLEAAEAYLAAAKGVNAADALEYQRRAAEQLLVSGHIDQGLDTVKTVLAAVGMRLPATPKRALASLVLQRAKLALRGLRYRERDPSQISAQELTRIDICWSVAGGLGLVDNLRGTLFQSRHLLLALAAGEPSRIARALAVEVNFRATAGGRARKRVQRFAEATRVLVDRLGTPPAIGRMVGAACGAAYLQGRFKDGLELSDRAVKICRDECAGMVWERDTAQLFGLFCLTFLGEIGELSRRVPLGLREATERGDLYLATNLRIGYPNLIWLARNDADGARREVEEAMTRWSPQGTHVQHFYELLAQTHNDLYRGDAASALTRIDQGWRRMQRAMLLRIQVTRVNMLHLRGRAALALAAHGASNRDELLARVESDAKRLEHERMPWSDGLALLLRAGVAALRGTPDRAIALAEGAEQALDAADMRLHAAAARRARGLLEKSARLAAADEWISAQGILRPEAMARLFAPGFEP
jgi:serine/threonine protein kinase